MKKIVLILSLCLPMWMHAAEQEAGSAQDKTSSTRVFSGFSIGILGNLGYAFAKSPDELYRNASMTDNPMTEGFSKQSITLGAGLMGRIHLLNHLHVGAEAYMSNMPLMSTGSGIRHLYAGGLIDGYVTAGKVGFFLGTGIGGGKIRRTFVPDKQDDSGIPDPQTGVEYNASFTTTPFFYLDPYLGIEVHFGAMLGMIIKLDYLLPFGSSKNVNWSTFINPTGPKLHVGVLLGK